MAAFEGRPILCAVLDAAALGSDSTEHARIIFDAGVDWIQLRDRSLDDAALLAIARTLTTARDDPTVDPTARARRRVLINKRSDIALASNADGVHLGFDAVAPHESRMLLPDRSLVGASLHSVQEVARAAESAGQRGDSAPGSIDDARKQVLDYAHLAPIWDPISKPATRPALGLERLRKACCAGLPLLAQGGVDPDRAAESICAGAAGVAVTGLLGSRGSLSASGGPGDAIRQLRASLDACRSDELP